MKNGLAPQVLKEARSLVKARDYAGALEKYIWFHDHALEHEPGMAGVRLSYAIDEWVELGELYAPARTALESVRDTKTQALLTGSADFDLFVDVRAINTGLGQERRTCELFARIAERDREFAEKCFAVAVESLVNAKEFALAKRLMPPSDELLNKFAAPLKSQLGRPDKKDERFPMSFHEMLMKIYANNVSQILQILVGVGDEDEAARMHKAAIDCFDDPNVRVRVAGFLSPGSHSKLVN